MKIDVKVLAHTKHKDLEYVSMYLYYPRFIHSQFVRHRSISHNVSSSRARKVSNIIEEIEAQEFPAKPVWRNPNKGMLSGTEIVDEQFTKNIDIYYIELFQVVKQLCNAYESHIEKGILNRFLEPFSNVHHIITARREPLEWFFNLRCNSEAQSEIQELANLMQSAYTASTPTEDFLHLPLVDNSERADYTEIDLCMISAARCARVSYANHEKKNCEKDIKFAQQLADNRHLSPFEMQIFMLQNESMRTKLEQDISELQWAKDFKLP